MAGWVRASCGERTLSFFAAYWRGHDRDDETVQADALRWLGASSTVTVTPVRRSGSGLCSVTTCSTPCSSSAGWCTSSGTPGLVVVLDEFEHIHDLARQARDRNYDALLGIVKGITHFAAYMQGLRIRTTVDYSRQHRSRGAA